jgi:prepilin-type processing-associated H-X9-DG protein
MMAGDRNLPMSGNSACSVMAAVSTTPECPAPFAFRWTSSLHNSAGNLLMFDGQVEQAHNELLRAAVDFRCGDGGSAHFCMPR